MKHLAVLVTLLFSVFALNPSAATIQTETSHTTFTVNSVVDIVDAASGDGVCETAPGIGSYPNVIVIVADALRSDHVSSYGYSRQTTPQLDAYVGNQGIRFANAESTSPWTHPSVSDMLTGIRSPKLGIKWENADAVLPENANTLAEYLHNAGFYTAGFAGGGAYRKFGYAQGFDHYVDNLPYEPGRWDSVRAAQVNSATMDWLGNTWTPTLSGTQPLFLFLYYMDPHTWYDPPPPYDTLYDPAYTGTLTTAVFEHGEGVATGRIVPTERDVKHVMALYDGEIAYWDTQLGQMLAYLQNLHVLDNALIIVTSDHGEMFGEHDKWVHGNLLYEELLRVPLLMRYTGVISPGQVVTTPVHSMDLMPAVLDLVGLAVPAGLDAASLRPLLQQGTAAFEQDIFSEQNGVTNNWTFPRSDLRSIRRGEWKLIHPVGDSNADELYRLKPSSPYETENLVAAEPGIALALRQALAIEHGERFTITGRIVGANGAPYSGATVMLTSGISRTREVSMTTTASGDYGFTDLPAGAYTLTPMLAGYSFLPANQAIALPPNAVNPIFTILPTPVSTTLVPGIATRLTYTDTQGLPTHFDFSGNVAAEDITVTVTPTLVANRPGLVFAGHAFDLAAYPKADPGSAFIFGAAVTITIHYSDRDVKAVSDQGQLVLQGWTGSEWEDATQTCSSPTAYSRDAANKTLGVPVCRLSRFGLLGPGNKLYLPLILRHAP